MEVSRSARSRPEASPSARYVVASWFKLTPTAAARVAKRRWSLLGMRCTNWPLYALGGQVALVLPFGHGACLEGGLCFGDGLFDGLPIGQHAAWQVRAA